MEVRESPSISDIVRSAISGTPSRPLLKKTAIDRLS